MLGVAAGCGAVSTASGGAAAAPLGEATALGRDAICVRAGPIAPLLAMLDVEGVGFASAAAMPGLPAGSITVGAAVGCPCGVAALPLAGCGADAGRTGAVADDTGADGADCVGAALAGPPAPVAGRPPADVAAPLSVVAAPAADKAGITTDGAGAAGAGCCGVGSDGG
jgi:hypothetical protein